jgi:hypothetical protein
MPRSSAQSDFVVRTVGRGGNHTEDAAGELPKAELVSTEASELATRWVMRWTWFVLVALALLCAIGPHIPSGE